jgi:sec-independent protein translocase protein TatA
MHLLVIFGIALLVFGPKKLPELGKGIGEVGSAASSQP